MLEERSALALEVEQNDNFETAFKKLVNSHYAVEFFKDRNSVNFKGLFLKTFKKLDTFKQVEICTKASLEPEEFNAIFAELKEEAPPYDGVAVVVVRKAVEDTWLESKN